MKRRKLLLVDDHEDFRKLLTAVVAPRGIQVVASSDGRDALRRLASSPDYGLIMLDLMMPGMDGFAFLAARERNPELLRVPLVVLSALSRKRELLRGYTINELLQKPIANEQVVMVASQYCA